MGEGVVNSVLRREMKSRDTCSPGSNQWKPSEKVERLAANESWTDGTGAEKN
jgi:hypothetical protein